MMLNQLKVSVGQYSDKGRKEINQDFHGVYNPQEPLLTSKGVAIALADGISSSSVSQIASEAAITGFLEDYFCTSEAWSVRKSAERVLVASNSWLYSQTRQSQYRYERDKGYVCTLSAMIIKSATAYLFHVGDARIYRRQGDALEQLTQDHCVWVSQDKSQLSRALGIDSHLEIDYQKLALEKGDTFLLATDGVYEYVDSHFVTHCIQEQAHDLDKAAKIIVEEAYQQGSTDNLTAQVVRIDELPSQNTSEVYQQLTELPFAPLLEARMSFDGYTIIRELHASSRSHVYLALDDQTQHQVVLKIPSIDLRDDPAYLERFLMEEWVGRRINSPYVLKPSPQTRKRNFIYIVTEFIDGQTLTQWMIDNPKADLESVRGKVEQIAKGLQAFHRQEMLHQDVRPENIMIDKSGTIKIIDFGATRVAGVMEMAQPIEQQDLLGTAQYTAPEYFLGEPGTPCSDLFSLGIITYQMLKGRLPYGAQVAKSRTKAAQRKLNYQSVLEDERDIPAWVDDVLKKAVQPNPLKRYQELSEFTFDLRQPNKVFLNKTRPPLMERNPVFFWKSVSFILALTLVILLVKQ